MREGVPFRLKRAKSMDFMEKNTIGQFKLFLRDLRARKDVSDMERNLLRTIISRLLVFGEDEVLIDYSDEFEDSYQNFEAVMGLLSKYSELYSTFNPYTGIITQFIMQSEFEEGCTGLSEESPVLFSLWIFLIQAYDLRAGNKFQVTVDTLSDGGPHQEDTSISSCNKLVMNLNLKRFEKLNTLKYFWKVLESSFQLKYMSIRATYHCSASCLEKISSKLKSKRGSSLVLQVKTAVSCSPQTSSSPNLFEISQLDIKLKNEGGRTSSRELIAMIQEPEFFRSFFRFPKCFKNLWKNLRKYSIALNFLDVMVQDIRENGDLWDQIAVFSERGECNLKLKMKYQ